MTEPVGVLRFILKGKRAHFRRFYTNSSALTYPVPPPATLLGLLAAALGLGREYTEELRNLWLSVRPYGPHRLLLQTVNYLFLKGGTLEEVQGLYKEGLTQIPVQYLVGEDGGAVAFEVYVASEKRNLVEQLHQAILSPAYPFSLGPAYALAWVEEGEVWFSQGEVKQEWEGEGIGWWKAEALDLKPQPGMRLYRDRFPVLIGPGRVPQRVEELALEVEGRPIQVRYAERVLVIEGQAIGVVRI